MFTAAGFSSTRLKKAGEFEKLTQSLSQVKLVSSKEDRSKLYMLYNYNCSCICIQRGKHSLHLLSSSLLSPQSSAPSHTQRLGMQRWFPHSNWVAEQNLSKKVPERMYEVPIRVPNRSKGPLQFCLLDFRVSGLTTVSLVRAVLTVVLLITSPAHRDATSTRTGEERRGAFCFPAPWQSKDTR